MKFVVYEGCHEVMVTTPEEEESFLAECFGENNRDLSDYDREEVTANCVRIRPVGVIIS
jgi:hypothetical protein